MPIPVLTPDDELPEVEAIIVTAFNWYSEIKKNLENKTQCPILSIADVIYQNGLGD